MEYVRLGNTGLKVSRICLGMMTYGSPTWHPWTLDEAAARPFVQRALEHGINFFDTADMYSRGVSEEITGRALRDFATRDQVIVATKVCQPMGDGPNDKGLSRKHILDGIDASLRRMGMDYVDLYIIHRFDYDTPMEETMRALDDVVRAGKARYIGASSMYAWQFLKMQSIAEQHGWTKFVSMQNHLNLIYREEEREMIPLCRAEGVGLTPYSPMARGFLAGDRKKQGGGETARANSDKLAAKFYFADSDFAIADRVVEVAKKRGVSRMQIALAWVLSRPGVAAPIVGASKMPHLDEAVEALHVKLSADECTFLEELYQPHRVVGPL